MRLLIGRSYYDDSVDASSLCAEIFSVGTEFPVRAGGRVDSEEPKSDPFASSGIF